MLAVAVLATLSPTIGQPTLMLQVQEQADDEGAPGEPSLEGRQPAETEPRPPTIPTHPAAADAPSTADGSADSPADGSADSQAGGGGDAGIATASHPSTKPAKVHRRPPAHTDACPADQGHARGAAFGADDRLVMTYYYYWYDQASLEDPAMSQHPPNTPPLDWRSVAWHERQLTDMATAGVDVALAVYWGDTDAWSVDGLKPMVEARERLLKAGLRPPAIGLFFDTNMYAMLAPDHPGVTDFTTQDGQAMLAHQVGVFLDEVPPCHRARIDGRVLAFFWRADTEDGDRFTFDERSFSGLNDAVEQRYGERLHFALEHSWVEAADRLGVQLGAADIYGWGAALNGPRFKGRTVAIGPGYDDRRIDGRPGYLRDRTEGVTYSRDLRSAVMSGSTWLLLETWNELWEGTAIAETEETGRTYLGITARYTALFHQLGSELARDGWFDLGSGQNAYLRRLADAPVEQGMPSEEAGRWGARPFREDEDGTGYFHFAIDRRLGLTEAQPLTVFVEYFDAENGSFALEYDSLDEDGPEGGVYTISEDVPFLGTGRWLIHRFELPDASLRARQYDGAGDFRIHDRPGTDDELHTFGRVMLTAAPAARPVPIGPESLTFVEPSPRQPVTLRWTEADGAAGYLVTIQPFTDPDLDPRPHGYTTEERRRCDGDAELEIARPSRGLTQRTSCELRLPYTLDEGIYRWQVQPLALDGTPRGQSSDWGYVVVARR
ncbi:MAG: hypothetical protein IT306_21230 [Chloroflexi bacterium]|nr:hypothetical protein [Chloroflexota bacterium]